MMVKDDLTSAASHLAGLRQSVAALREHLGTTVDVRRLRDDIARLADDLDLVAHGAGVGSSDRVGAQGEIVFIPDEDYDPALWADAEDEGLGAHRGC